MSADRKRIVAFLVDHFEHPRNQQPIAGADIHETSGNTECGDFVEAYATIATDNDGSSRLDRLAFEAQGSTVCVAAASYLSERLRGMPLDAVEGFDQETLLDELGREVVASSRVSATLALVTLQRGVHHWRLRHISS
ncbi:MAG TPA: iron-sulfur cluster assembly scaffold protein [Ktedonobacterales bacterium]